MSDINAIRERCKNEPAGNGLVSVVESLCDEIDRLQGTIKALKLQLRLAVAQRNCAEDELRTSKSQGAV